MNLNRVTLIGHVGKDPEIRETKTGSKMATFSVATSQVWYTEGQKNEKTEWHRIVCWGKITDACKYIEKGTLVYVEGAIQSSKYKDKEGVERTDFSINAFRISSLEKRKKEETKAPEESHEEERPPLADDDIPF